jgi:hypothetical protein
VADRLALQLLLDLREKAAEAVQVRHLGVVLLEGLALAVLQFVRQRHHRTTINLHACH